MNNITAVNREHSSAHRDIRSHNPLISSYLHMVVRVVQHLDVDGLEIESIFQFVLDVDRAGNGCPLSHRVVGSHLVVKSDYLGIGRLERRWKGRQIVTVG